jgi:dTDP-glucose 4,6-dehydratase
MPTVLVTGASGFVGRSLLPALFRAGSHKIVVLDREPLPQGTRTALSEAGGTATEILSESLPDSSLIPDLSCVVALAGTTSVDAALAEPRAAIEGNLRIAVDLAEWARTNKRRVRVVYVSSDEVLGGSVQPLPESAALAPTQPYAASKAAAEILLHCYRDVYHLNIATLRSCNLVGPGQSEPKLLPVTVRALLENRPVPIHGSGEQSREWMDVDDLVNAILILMDPDTPASVYQAASGVHLPVSKVVELVASGLQRRLVVEHVTDRKVQDPSYAMGTDRLSNLGWKVQHDPIASIGKAAIDLAAEFSNQQPSSYRLRIS